MPLITFELLYFENTDIYILILLRPLDKQVIVKNLFSPLFLFFLSIIIIYFLL